MHLQLSGLSGLGSNYTGQIYTGPTPITPTASTPPCTPNTWPDCDPLFQAAKALTQAWVDGNRAAFDRALDSYHSLTGGYEPSWLVLAERSAYGADPFPTRAQEVIPDPWAASQAAPQLTPQQAAAAQAQIDSWTPERTIPVSNPPSISQTQASAITGQANQSVPPQTALVPMASGIPSTAQTLSNAAAAQGAGAGAGAGAGLDLGAMASGLISNKSMMVLLAVGVALFAFSGRSR